jgi:transposase
LLGVSVLPANHQDRDGARDLLRAARRRFPFVERIFADAGYQGPKMAEAAARAGCWKIEIVKRSDLHRFVVLPKRNRRSLYPSRNDPAHAQTLDKAKPLLMNPFFLDRLLALPRHDR